MNELEQRIADFKRATLALYEAWEHVPYEETTGTYVEDRYPFEQDFGEVLAKINEWSDDK